MTKPASSSGKKKKQKKGVQSGSTAVAESSRIRINQILQNFRLSKNLVYIFESNLTNPERAVVHVQCRKMGMRSKSHGRGDQRQVNVYKKKKKKENTKKKNENLTSFRFSDDSKVVLQDLFTRYPPGDDEGGQEMAGKHNRKTDKIQQRKDDIFCKPSMTKNEVAKRLDLLSSKVEKIMEERSKLPIASFREAITTTVESHQVVLISGETGCGKTTQVPQFLLDHMWVKGEACKIVCTQPRRISAVSVAERISFERGENVGDSVGYKIRLESKGGRHSSIVFCTNGIMLRVLISKGGGRSNAEASRKLSNDNFFDITHIIVDEIHERDRYSDFMLAIIRDMLPLYPHLRLVLMSATIDAERFSEYFGGCPIIRVPGFTYPIKSFYLEDVLSILKSTENNHLDCTSSSDNIENSQLTDEFVVALDEAINLAWSNDEFDPLLEFVSSEGGPRVYNYQHSSTGVTPLMVFAGKGRVGDVCMLLSFGANCHLRANDETTAFEWAERENHREAAEILKKQMEKGFTNSDEERYLVDKYLSTVNTELIDVVLIERLLRKICTDLKDGAILVFLPGWDDINRTRERLRTSIFFKDSSKFLVLPLHSMVPSVEQKKVFKRPPPGCLKIVLSTNIAETAITIDDVVCVIDSGRMKEKSYDPYNNVSTLHSSWVSKASAKQREGRAGRCQPGICYHLYSNVRAASLPDFQVPEIKRMPIEEICLQVKLLDPDWKIEEFLKKTLDPPVFETIRNAIIVLQDIGALTFDERLTDLGERLGCLPVHPVTSKMLFYAVLLKCLDPALTLACASDYRDPFTLPMLPNEKKRAAAAKSELASLYGGHSDQLAVIAAFECWKKAKGKGQETRFCSEYFISSGTMRMLSQMRTKLLSELQRNGFIPEDITRCSLNAHDPGILQAVLVAGVYPMVGRLLPPSGKRSFLETAAGNKVRLHPHSTNFKLSFKKSDDLPLIVYDEITHSNGGLHIRNCSLIGPLPLFLLATEIVVAPVEDIDDDSDYENCEGDESDEDKLNKDQNENLQYGEKIMSSPDNTAKVVVDRWLSFESTALDVAQIYCLRERLSAAILFKVTHPREVLPELLGASMYTIACILSFDGMPQKSLLLEPVDSLTSMASATEIGASEPGKKEKDDRRNSFLNSLISHGPPRNFTSHHQRRRPSAYARIARCSDLSDLYSRHPASAYMNAYERSETQVPTLASNGPSSYNFVGTREDSFKLQHGNGSWEY